jgi:hypothetical protein
MAMSDLSPDGFFLCCGLPKSGTTFLQRMLDLHPQVSCPSEHNLVHLSTQLDRLLEDYGKTLTIIDRRTGGQGATLPDKNASLEILRATILALARSAARDKPVYGLNDNAIFSSVGFADELFQQPKMIAIIRNPVDLCMSAWRHNLRLAREEPQQAAVHLDQLRNPAGTLDGYVLSRSGWYNANLQRFLDYAKDRPNIIITHYEQLVRNKQSELVRLFAFLNTDTSGTIIDTIVGRSSLTEMARNSTHPAFFGVGDDSRETMTVSLAVRTQALEQSRSVLERIGYDLSQLMAGA